MQSAPLLILGQSVKPPKVGGELLLQETMISPDPKSGKWMSFGEIFEVPVPAELVNDGPEANSIADGKRQETPDPDETVEVANSEIESPKPSVERNTADLPSTYIKAKEPTAPSTKPAITPSSLAMGDVVAGEPLRRMEHVQMPVPSGNSSTPMMDPILSNFIEGTERISPSLHALDDQTDAPLKETVNQKSTPAETRTFHLDLPAIGPQKQSSAIPSELPTSRPDDPGLQPPVASQRHQQATMADYPAPAKTSRPDGERPVNPIYRQPQSRQTVSQTSEEPRTGGIPFQKPTGTVGQIGIAAPPKSESEPRQNPTMPEPEKAVRPIAKGPAENQLKAASRPHAPKPSMEPLADKLPAPTSQLAIKTGLPPMVTPPPTTDGIRPRQVTNVAPLPLKRTETISPLPDRSGSKERVPTTSKQNADLGARIQPLASEVQHPKSKAPHGLQSVSLEMQPPTTRNIAPPLVANETIEKPQPRLQAAPNLFKGPVVTDHKTNPVSEIAKLPKTLPSIVNIVTATPAKPTKSETKVQHIEQPAQPQDQRSVTPPPIPKISQLPSPHPLATHPIHSQQTPMADAAVSDAQSNITSTPAKHDMAPMALTSLQPALPPPMDRQHTTPQEAFRQAHALSQWPMPQPSKPQTLNLNRSVAEPENTKTSPAKKNLEPPKSSMMPASEMLYSVRSETTTAPLQHGTTPAARMDLPAHVSRQVMDVIQHLPNKPVEISLNPEELGRLRLAVSATDAGLLVNVVAERPETLELLRRHISMLGQEFQTLGYEDVSFSFNEDAQSHRSQDRDDDQSQRLAEHSELGFDRAPSQQSPVNLPAQAGLDLRL